MKNLVLVLFAVAALGGHSIGQSYDDGLVSSHLSVSTDDARFTAFVNGFRSGMSRVRSGELTSPEGIAAACGVDICSYPKIGQVVNSTNWAAYNGTYSPSFLINVKGAIDKSSDEYETIGQLRNDLLGIAQSGTLSEKEATALALIDIAVQEVKREVSFELAYRRKMHGTTGESFNDGFLLGKTGTKDTDDHNEYKLKDWVKCALGVVGTAILGGLSGVSAGAKIGVIFGLHGAAVGGAIGGIVGVIGGTFAGAAKYCD